MCIYSPPSSSGTEERSFTPTPYVGIAEVLGSHVDLAVGPAFGDDFDFRPLRLILDFLYFDRNTNFQ